VVAAALAVVRRGAARAAGETKERPSVVVILVDTLRADFLGTYGFDGPVSPQIDRFASESIQFDSAFAQAPWTKPSIASLFTSLAPETHRVLTHDGKYADDAHASTEALPQEAATLAESFQQAGYATAAFVANPWLLREHGFAQGFDLYDQRQGAPLPPRAGVMLDAARQWIDARPKGQPFFAYVHLMDVHGPYDAPDADYDAVRDSPGLGPSRQLDDATLAQLRPYLRRGRWVNDDSARDLRNWRAHYAAGVHALDRQLGTFLAGLARSGVLERTIVVLTADHGEELADNGGWDHGFKLYEHQLHVPLLVRPAGGAAAGRRVREIVSLIDVMPSLLGQAGIAPPSTAQGRDLSPQLAGRDAGASAGASFASGVKWNPEMRSLRAPGRKLIEDARAPSTELFDLTSDPTEQKNVAASRPEERAGLEQVLRAHQRALAGAPALVQEKKAVSEEMKKRLEALGYAH
ncbi:sulfatase-like hydrolase/transferase, partial [Candidatus Binatia bacterium]|nr:sulfatase-like hydrolase/transferase [Candidatus Binatia bacterium]